MPWGVAAAAVGAAGSVIGGKEAAGNKPKNYLKPYEKFALNRGEDIANRPYEGYEGDRVAGLSENEQIGGSMARSAVKDNQARSYLDKAGEQIGNLSEWNGDTAKKYMNPYVEGVVNQGLRNENLAYAQRRGQVAARASSMDAFGGDRSALQEAAETGKHLEAVGDITTNGYAAAWQDAQRTWAADNQRKLAASQAYSQLGQDVNNLNADQITDLLRTGQGERLLRQMNMDVDYSSFIEQRDWDVTNLQPLLGAISASHGSTPNAPQKTGSTAGSILGAAATAIGYFGGSKSNSGSLESQISDLDWQSAMPQQ